MTLGVVLVAAGTGERLGAGGPKALVPLGGRPLLVHALDAIAAAGLPSPVVVVTPGAEPAFAAALAGRSVQALVPGGLTRSDSVRAGLGALPADVTTVAVHDAARALMPAEVLHRCVAALTGDVVAVAPALPVADTLKRTVQDTVTATVSRAGLVGVQTPQVFPRAVLTAALEVGGTATDDLALVEAAIAAGQVTGRVVVVAGSVRGAKITYPEDLVVAEALLAASEPTGGPATGHGPDIAIGREVGMPAVRIGTGIDVHPFSEDPARPLILAGVTVPGATGLAGHSDADVATHAVADALLGAAALGDLGSRFGVDRPDTRGAASLGLLAAVVDDVAAAGWAVGNLDVTVIAQRPRLAPHRDAMRSALAATLACEAGAVSVKFTTTDGLGTLGRGEGIAAQATCLLLARR